MDFIKVLKGFFRKIFPKKKNIFVISDLHLGHQNVIRYCKRPFENSESMDCELARRWNNAVKNDDTVYFLGDFVFHGSPKYWKTNLKGRKTFIRGNHDHKLKGTVHDKVIEHKGFRFYLVHNPNEIPPDWKDWVLYGHEHNNNLSKFPFIDGDRKRINVSVEVIDYRPLNLDNLISLDLPNIRWKETLRSPTEYR